MKLKTIAWAENVIDFNGGVAELSGIEEVATLFDSPVVMMKRSKSGEKELDISPLVKSAKAELDGDTLRVTVVTSASGENYLNPEYAAKAVAAKLGIDADKTWHVITRTKLLLADGKTLFN